MKVPFTQALRAELSRAQVNQGPERLALFAVGLDDEGDLPAWALACELLPERFRSSPVDWSCAMVVGAVPLRRLVHTLHRAGERDLSAKLHASDAHGVPLLLLRDVVRTVTALHHVEALEAEAMLKERALGSA